MSIFIIAAIIGLALPAISAALVFRKDKILLTAILLFLLLQILQIMSEKILAGHDLRNLIKYTASAFVILRLAQLAWIWKLKARLISLKSPLQYFLFATYLLNWGLWSYVLVRLVMRICRAHDVL